MPESACRTAAPRWSRRRRAPKKKKCVSRPGWFPSEAELQGIDVRELVVKMILDQGLLVASGMSVHAEKAGGNDAYRAKIEGRIAAPAIRTRSRNSGWTTPGSAIRTDRCF